MAGDFFGMPRVRLGTLVAETTEAAASVVSKTPISAIGSACPQLAGHEVIGRPGTADHHFAILQLARRRALTVLVLLHRARIDEVGDIDQQPAGIDLLADDLLLQRR